MYTFNNGLIGHDLTVKPQTQFFSSSDSEERYAESLKTKPSNWEYRTTPVTYKRNSLGHRSIEINDLNFDNYILFLGCSITEGIGLPVEKRFSNVVADMLNCHAYTIGLAGTGNDVITYNLFTWLHKFKRPKLIVLQWTGSERFLSITKDEKLFPNGSWCDKKIVEFMSLGNEIKYFKARDILYRNLITNLIPDIPIIEIRIGEFYPLKDEARDLLHPGVNANQLKANSLYEEITKLKLFS